MEKNYDSGDVIHFFLDGGREGWGVVKDANAGKNAMTVKLTTQCKEFTPGTIIIVLKHEIV